MDLKQNIFDKKHMIGKLTKQVDEVTKKKDGYKKEIKKLIKDKKSQEEMIENFQ